MATRKLQFMDLSTDIHNLVFDHITRPTDMKNLCLVNHHFHQLAVRQLYHTVTFDVGCPGDTKLSAFLNPRNIGLPWIRNVELYLAEVPDKCGQLNQANFAIRMLLEFLPENVVEKFSWHPWQAFNADNMALLYKKQKKMKWLEAITLDRRLCDCLKKSLDFDTITENTTKLGLYPDSQDVLDYCHELVVRTKNIKKITLHANFDELDPPIPARELNDSPTAAGRITSTIFSHMGPDDRFSKCTPMNLTELTLQKINLRYASDSYCKIVNFAGLKTLRVFGCMGADALFAELCKSSKLPEKLKTLEFKHDDDQREYEGLNALDSFLCLVSGVQRLTIDLGYTKALPAAAGIERHARTLKSLNVHASPGDADEDEHVYDLESFQKICRCLLLEQISLAFPQTSITRDASEDFAAFTSALGALSKLVTLNMTTWPTNTPSSNKLPRKVYEHLLQGMAQTGFNVSAANAAEQTPPLTSKLAVIAFGTSDKIYEREDSKNCMIFVKGKQVDPFGKESPLAVQVGWCLRKYIETRSDVLDFALARSVRPPTKEAPASDDSE